MLHPLDKHMTDPTFLGQAGHDAAHPWMVQAACANHSDPDLWFPGTGDQVSLSAPAKAICRDCPVQPECLDYALTYPSLQGIWGGLTEPERRQLRRKANR